MKNILIGFLGATCMFLMIGTTQEMFVTTSDNGMYQAWSEAGKLPDQFMINTRTGEFYKISREKINGEREWVWVKINTTDTIFLNKD